MLEQFHKFVDVGKATIPSSDLYDSMLKFEALLDEALLLQSSPIISVVGNILTSISDGDQIVLGICKYSVKSAKYESFQNSSLAGGIYESKYFSSKQRIEAETNGYTLIEVQSNETNITEACGIIEDVSAKIEIGSYVASRKPLPGLVNFEPHPVENAATIAYTTVDLSHHLSLFDTVYTSSDAFQVKLITPTKLILSGHVSVASEGEKLYVEAKGTEHIIIMREFSSDLDTFRVVPDDSLKGIGARIYTETPYYRQPLTYILGNPSEIQVFIFKNVSPELELNFTLSLDGHSSNPIQWPEGDGLTAAEEIRSSVSSFSTVLGDVYI